MRTYRLRPPALMLFLVVLSMPLAGCLAAAGGAAAGSGIYLTTRGAEGVIHGDIEELTSASRDAFDTLGVEYKGQRDQDEDEREVYGATDDGDVTVDLERRTKNATMVNVKVKKTAVTWDKEMAKRILEEIQAVREG